MSSSWVAASVRARLLTSRRLGSAAARELALSPSLEAALRQLMASPYGHDVAAGMNVEEAQAAVAATLLWHLRILAGWLPPGAGEVMRSLAAWFEIANVRARLAFFRTGERQPMFEMGSLATAWPELSQTSSAIELHQALRHTAWGGQAGVPVEDIITGMQLRWAARLLDAIPFASAWITAATLLLLARLMFLPEGASRRMAPEHIPGLSSGWQGVASVEELCAAAPPAASWVLEGVREPTQLWVAEGQWWQRISQEANGMIVRAASSPETVVASAALLAADAWRTRAALSVCASKGRSLEVFDAVA